MARIHQTTTMDPVPPPDTRVSRLLLGPSLPNSADRRERLGNPAALAILSSDALSSVAYATEEMVKVLLPVAGIAAFTLSVPLSGVVILLLLTLVFSYRQTIRAYPNAGGAYVVTRDNFGLLPAQVAGVALLADYVTTVAVSISAGTAAIYSQFPSLFAYRVPTSVAFIWLITWGNLRGLRMAGRLFSAPTYLFLLAMFSLLAVGGLRALSGNLHPLPPPDGLALPPETAAVGLFVLLHAYASGTTALTGVEAISNGVSVFRPPEASNAIKVLTSMGAILAVTFGGITLLAWRVHPVPTQKTTLVSELGNAVFGRGSTGAAARLGLQLATTAILVLAANTAYSDFPRLASFQAADGFLPRPLRRRGRRLAFSTGIVALACVSSAVVVLFGADVHRLIPLYAVGAFASFTLSQAGMSVRHWRLREGRWRRHLAVNASGALGSGLALVAVAIAKFNRGAWVVVVFVPVAVMVCLSIHRHYLRTDRRLAALGEPGEPLAAIVVVRRPRLPVEPAVAYARGLPIGDVRVVSGSTRTVERSLLRGRRTGGRVLVVDTARRGSDRTPFGSARRLRRQLSRRSGGALATISPDGWDHRLDASTRHAAVVVVGDAPGLVRRALALARTLGPTEMHTVYVDLDFDPGHIGDVVERWARWGFEQPLEVLPAPYREPGGPVRTKVRSLLDEGVDVVSVVVAEVVPRWWHRPLYDDDGRRLRGAVLTLPRTAVVEDPIAL